MEKEMSFFKKVKNSDIETNSTEVLKNILMRKKQIASNNFNRYEDGNKIGLVVQGGNMRGIISGGALIGLESLGLTDVFDIVYGSMDCFCIPEISIKSTSSLPETKYFLLSNFDTHFLIQFRVLFQ